MKRRCEMKGRAANIFVRFLILLAIVVGGYFILKTLGLVDLNEGSLEEKNAKELSSALEERGLDQEFFKQEKIDTDEFFDKNSEVFDKLDARESFNSYTEEEVADLLYERGFDGIYLETSYDGDCKIMETREIDPSKADLHPTYIGYYTSDYGLLWQINVTGLDITASPIGYEEGNIFFDKIIFAESDLLTSFDSSKKIFYETLPKEGVINLRNIGLIDKAKLDKESEKLGDL